MKTYFNLKGFFTSDTNPTHEKPSQSPKEMLLDDIKKTQTALEIAYLGFDNAIDPDLIDCYIYEINSVLKRYRFLIQQANHMQLCESIDYHNESLFTEHKLVSQLCPIPSNLYLNHN